MAVICGNDESKGPNYSVKLDANNYVLTVRVALTSKNVLSDVAKLLDRVVPSNLLIDLSLLYNQLSKFTHEELKKYTHIQLREEVFEEGRSTR